jgi:hypothetical protein
MAISVTARLRRLLLGGVMLSACSNQPASPVSDASGACPALREAEQNLSGHCTAADGGGIAVPTLPSTCTEAPERDLPAVPEAAAFANAASLEVDDAECKYHVSLRAICDGSTRQLAFLADVTKRDEGTHATQAAPWLDAIQGNTHPAPNAKRDYEELQPGVYRFGPVQFDRPGTWSLEMHVYGLCPNSPLSPHGHVYLEADIP